VKELDWNPVEFNIVNDSPYVALDMMNRNENDFIQGSYI
jgi:hypothetical protein